MLGDRSRILAASVVLVATPACSSTTDPCSVRLPCPPVGLCCEATNYCPAEGTPCFLTGAPVTFDVSNVNLHATPQLQVQQSNSGGAPPPAIVTIDGKKGQPRVSTIPGDADVTFYFFPSLPLHPMKLTYDAPRASGVEASFAFVNEACLAKYETAVCHE